MTNRMMVWLCLAFATTSTPALCREKPVQDCKVTFAVVYLDRLNNTNNGIPAKSVKDVEKRLSKYGDVCYAGDKQADLIFFIHTTPASAAAAASSSSTTIVPYADGLLSVHPRY